MAKQVGPIFFTGTIDGLIFYKLGDKYYTRAKGAYKSARHMRRNPRYRRTLQQADRFGRASQLVQEIYYRHLPKAIRKHGLFGKLTGMVNSWLYKGKSVEEVRQLLLAHCQELAAAATTATAAPKETATTPTRSEERTTNNTQPSTNVEQQSPVNAQRPSACRTKQPYSRSRWKVKRNGRLHVPHSPNRLPMAAPLSCYAEHVSAAHLVLPDGSSLLHGDLPNASKGSQRNT